jgi:phosphoribosylformylglycinamidine cyclo-ligase
MTDAYKEAGVDIEAGNRAVQLMGAAVRSTYGPEVLAGIGNFGGLYAADAVKDMDAPVLVASTDGIGTKTKIAAALGRFRSLGLDIVNHCVNDILVQGARPLFFLDYVGTSKLKPEVVAEIVDGAAQACREAECALLGGETAEMPGVYGQNEWDVVGTIVGVVERARIIDGGAIAPGDELIGLPSSGLHTNGYSLARRVFEAGGFSQRHPSLDGTVGEELLIPHRSYLAAVERARAQVTVKGLAHITGGGFIDNIPRILPQGLGVRIQKGTWPIPPIFDLIQSMGAVVEDEMYHVFNMGIGMVVVIDPSCRGRILEAVGEPAHVIGEVIERREGLPHVLISD